jgi:3-deoxy-7-phosphoheptulonate synthase
MVQTSDLRIRHLDPIPTPQEVVSEFPLSEKLSQFVTDTRVEVENILLGKDKRLLCIVGPCSIHDINAATDYAGRLASAAKQYQDDLLIVMRTYFEKPRTTIGWKGLINDPDLNGTYDIPKGLRLARRVLHNVLDQGISVATEFLDPISPQFTADAVSYGAIGARTTESPVHRQLVSGLSMPVGFKNTTSGSLQAAADACVSAKITHTFLSVNPDGKLISAETSGNEFAHIILRGSASGPNYRQEFVDETLAIARLSDAPKAAQQGVVIDAAHGNSNKNEFREVEVVHEIAERIADGAKGISGIMMESFIEGGAQNAAPLEMLTYGKSVTDPCINWGTSLDLLEILANAVRSGRSGRSEGKTASGRKDSKVNG